jgi:hypothetical protein
VVRRRRKKFGWKRSGFKSSCLRKKLDILTKLKAPITMAKCVEREGDIWAYG